MVGPRSGLAPAALVVVSAAATQLIDCGSARAAFFIESTAEANADFCFVSYSVGAQDSKDCGQLPGSTAASASAGAPGQPNIGATSTVSADFDALRAVGDAFAFSGIGPINGAGKAAVCARAIFGDLVNVGSSVLAPGSPVTLEVTITLSDTLRRASLQPFTDLSGNITSAETLADRSETPLVTLIAAIDGFASDFELANFLGGTGKDSDARVQTIMVPLQTTIGSKFIVSETLSAGGPADETLLPNQQFVSLAADAFNTGTLGILSDTPGVTVIGDSGHDYAAALAPEPQGIPEPSSMMLFAAGPLDWSDCL